MTMLAILDRWVSAGEPGHQQWSAELEASLRTEVQSWVSELGRLDRPLSDDRAWVLLGWAESEASRAVTARRPDLLELALVAFCLLGASDLDRRDVSIVASLVRRAADLLDADYRTLLESACGRAGELGAERRWLALVSAATPSTHTEVWGGSVFEFRRVPVPFDPEALKSRLLREPGTQPERPPAEVPRTGRDAQQDAAAPSDEESDGWWPDWAWTPAATIVGVTVTAVVFVAVVVGSYGRGLLPIAGVFVAMAVGPVIVFWRRAGLARRRGRLVQAVLDRLSDVMTLLAQERRLPEAARPTGAATSALLDAEDLADRAVQRFAWGDEAGAAAVASELTDHVRLHGWRPSPLTAAVRTLDAPLRDLTIVLGKLDAEAAKAARGR